ncbi:MAG: VirB4 family type IV secretion system protein [Candidatus Dormibacteria bacterium]
MRLAVPGGTRSSTTGLLDVEFVEHGAARLGQGGWRAALEVEPLNLALQGESERTRIWRRYRQMLSALPGPVSLYYLSRPRDPQPGSAPPTDRPEALADLCFQGELVRERLIQEQRHLVVVWSGRPLGPLAGLDRLAHPRRGADGRPEGDLDQRCLAVGASLERVGLRARRLQDGQWLELLQRCTGGRSGRRPATFASWLAPQRVEVGARRLLVDGRAVRSLVISGYPRRVGLGWLAPVLLSPPCDLRLAEHIYPVPKLASLSHLRRRIRSFETSLQVDHLRGQRPDRGTEAALGDALQLEERVLLEEEHLFQMAICVTVEAGSDAELERGWHQLVSRLAELGCTGVPLTHRQADGYRMTLPLGVDPVGWGRDMTASALATALPFMRTGLSTTRGVLLGPSLVSRELVVVDPFSARNPNFNVIVLGTSGAGKSYTAKLLAARLRLLGCRLHCLDPMGEYQGLARLLGEGLVELGAGPGSGLNPLGPPAPEGDGLGAERRAAAAMLVLEGLALERGPDRALPEGLAAPLREALLRVIQRAPQSARLADLVAELEEMGVPLLARRLRQFTRGLDAGVFDGSLPLAAVMSLARVERDRERLLPSVMQMVLLHLEADLAASPEVPRLILVDEAEVLLSSPRSAEALEGLSRRLRKLGAGLMVISQVVEDFLNSEVGNVIIRNCHTKLLLRQEEVAIPALRQAFGLSPAECDLLRDADPGSGLVLVGRERAAFTGAAPPQWREALSTDARPQEAATTSMSAPGRGQGSGGR